MALPRLGTIIKAIITLDYKVLIVPKTIELEVLGEVVFVG